MAKVEKTPLLKDGDFKVEKVIELAFFDLTGEKAKTFGTSNKSYHTELMFSISSQQAQVYSMWGPTGGHQTKDWRYYDSHEAALKDFNKIVKSKIKKGYQEVDVAQRAYGSDAAKQITKAVTFKNAEPGDNTTTIKVGSSLSAKVQYLMGELFGHTQNWVVQILKCPLGQLTNTQIDKGRGFLSEAKTIVDNTKKLSKTNEARIAQLTNDFYTAIPHNLGTGKRGQMTHLLLDTSLKIAEKESDLDTLIDAKSVGAVLAGSAVDDQYKTLNVDLEYIENQDPLFSWINDLVVKTRAHNHSHLGKIKVLNVWKLNRHNSKDNFLKTAKQIAETCNGQVIPDMLKPLGVNTRTDIDDARLYQKANVLPLFHGTRTQNIIGITKQGLMIRPHNVVLTGSMYGNGIYNGMSSKSINYTNIKTSYWANGNDDKAFLFITDTILGNTKNATGAHQYTRQNIKPYHSVWAKGGYSGVINDEWITYDTAQVNLRYLIEFTCQK